MPTPPTYRIVAAQPAHLAALAPIELSAATLLAGHAPPSVLQDVTPEHEFRRAQRQGRLWVALADRTPVGFALVDLVAGGHPHLREMDVLPAHGRRGVGAALLRAVLVWTRRAGHAEFTLTTFRAVPWNMPFYARLGFEEIPAGEVRAGLATMLHNEAVRGLDPTQRVAMRYRVKPA
jgi:GNAT superfamily N-acetyltransferase